MVSRYDGATIEILNWDRYNPKRDQSTYTWLRLNNDIATDPKLFSLTAGQKFGWITLLCEASRANGSTVRLNAKWFERVVGLALKEFESLMDFLVETEVITVTTAGDRARPQNVAARPQTTPTERTNETNETNVTRPASRPAFDFERIYQGYPRKEGKKRGLEICARQIKTEEDFLKLTRAVVKYRDHVRNSGTEPKFVKHFDTFMGSWPDWAEPDAGKVLLTAPEQRRFFDERPPEEDIPLDPEAPAKIAAIMKTAFKSMPR